MMEKTLAPGHHSSFSPNKIQSVASKTCLDILGLFI